MIGITKEITTVVAVLTFVVAVATLVKAILEYVRQNALKRFEKFQDISKKLQEEEMNEICVMLDDRNEAIRHIAYKRKFAFLAIIEEVAAMLNSKLITEYIAYYFCGYYALLCDETPGFWQDVKKEQWVLFNYFVGRMRRLRVSLGSERLPKPKTLRF